jgi:hypothetical protein
MARFQLRQLVNEGLKFGFHNKRAFSSPDEQLSASQEGFTSYSYLIISYQGQEGRVYCAQRSGESRNI